MSTLELGCKRHIHTLPCLQTWSVQMEPRKVEALPNVVPGRGGDEAGTLGHDELGMRENT